MSILSDSYWDYAELYALSAYAKLASAILALIIRPPAMLDDSSMSKRCWKSSKTVQGRSDVYELFAFHTGANVIRGRCLDNWYIDWSRNFIGGYFVLVPDSCHNHSKMPLILYGLSPALLIGFIGCIKNVKLGRCNRSPVNMDTQFQASVFKNMCMTSCYKVAVHPSHCTFLGDYKRCGAGSRVSVRNLLRIED
jgi:hypothetical protein